MTKNVIILKQEEKGTPTFFSKTFKKENDFNEALFQVSNQNMLTSDNTQDGKESDALQPEEISDEELARRLRPD